MNRRLAIALSAAALGGVMLSPGAQAATPAQRQPQAEQYVPFVTDFPHVAAAPTPAADSGGIDWRDVGIGGSAAAALAALIAGSAFVLIGRGRPAPG